MEGSPEIPTGLFAGRYTIERELGRGATATVYLARDREAERAVAIKVLRPELAASMGAERFLREIAVNERLKHPNIAPVLASGEHDGLLFFVLPHMEGGTLRHLMRREKQLPVDRAVEIARAIAAALEHAHSQGLIHRDIKPENILFSSGEACLADFGIAKAIERTIDESTTSTGLIRGTPAYMSPEQASGSKDYDGRSDQYSLACVLYEMIAGVPAFIGPTPEAIIAQRFQHAPRKLHIYRSSVSAGLEAVVERALAITPADRFASVAAFADALRDAPRQPTIEAPAKRKPIRAAIVATVLGLAVLVATAVADGNVFDGFNSRADADSTRIAVLPFEESLTSAAPPAHELLHAGLRRWTGITVVSLDETRDAVGSQGWSPLQSAGAAREVAERVRAGRYVVGRIRRTTTGQAIAAELRDARGKTVHGAEVPLPTDAKRVDAAFAALADSLLLRGKPSSARSTVLPAVVRYALAQDARAALDLGTADSLLMDALAADSGFSQAALLLAQVREWRNQPVGTWRTLVERALADTALASDERVMADALKRLANGDGPRACAAIERLAFARSTDFAAWYSFASCIRHDSLVIRDQRSPSGWRFRSSYNRAVRAYARAFELAPALHRRFQPGAFKEMRNLLFISPGMLRSGSAASPDTGRFYAYAAWVADSLSFVPYPLAAVTGGRVPLNPDGWALANEMQKQAFVRIARSWATAMPNNSGTLEALAISLDLVGSPGAIDTMRIARTLASDAAQRRRIAAHEVLLLVAASRHDPTNLRAAVALSDSLLGAPEDDPNVAPIAAIRGRCRLAGHLSATPTNSATANARDLQIPFAVYAAAESLSVFAALGCAVPSDTNGMIAADRSLSQSPSAATSERRSQLRSMLFARVFRGSLVGPAWLRDSTGAADYVLRAQQLASAGDVAGARRILDVRRAARGSRGTSNTSPDAVIAEALLLAAMGDSAGAAQWLDPLLNRSSWLEWLSSNSVAAGAMIRACLLRARLATALGERESAEKWARLAGSLWHEGDPETQSQVKGLRWQHD
jgi:serine/threonine protein kinase